MAREDGKVSGAVALLSGLSGWSLVFFGGLSLLAVCFSWSWPGALIGALLLAHGVWELRWRGRLLSKGDSVSGRRLAWNQLALAGSVALYLGWQAAALDRDELEAMFAREPLRGLMQQLPVEMAEQLTRDFPQLLAGAYGVAGLLVLLGCLGMALMYFKAGRREAA